MSSSQIFSIKFFLALLCLLQFASPSLSRAETVNRIVAVVNDQVITLKDLQDEGGLLFKKISQKAPPDQLENAMRSARRELLSTLIDKKIIEQRAAKLGFTVTDEELDQNINQILVRKGLDREAFLLEITRIGDTVEHYRSMLRAQLLQSKLINFDVRSKVVITDDKVRSYYDGQFASATAVDGYHLQQIGVAWDKTPPARSREEAQKIIAELRSMAISGADFEQLARTKSDLPSAVDGGDIGIFEKDEMASYMLEAISTIKAGEISPVVETPNTFQFFKLVASKDGNVVSKAPYETVKEDIRKKLYNEELEKNFHKWVQQLREQADISEFL